MKKLTILFLLFSTFSVAQVVRQSKLILNRDHDLAKGLILALPMNEGGGLSLRDATEIARSPVSMVNGAVFSQSQSMPSALFDGSNDYMQISNFNFGSNIISFSWWMYVSAFNNTDDLFLESSINCNNTPYAILIDPCSGAPNSGLFQVFMGGTAGTNRLVQGYTRPSAGVWHHYVVVFDGSIDAGAHYVYFDGVLQTATQTPNNTRTGTSNFATNNLYIMCRASNALFLNAQVNNILVYNRRLNQQEVRRLYTEPYSMYLKTKKP